MAFPTDCLPPITHKGFFPKRHFESQEALFVSINPWAKSFTTQRLIREKNGLTVFYALDQSCQPPNMPDKRQIKNNYARSCLRVGLLIIVSMNTNVEFRIELARLIPLLMDD